MHHRTSGRRGFSSTTRRLRVVPRPPSCSPASLIYNYSYISWYTNWQTHCHLRGNFPCLGEERATKKSTEPLADAMARLLGMRGTAPRPHGSSGKLSPRRRTTPTDELSHPPGWRSGAPGGCTALTDHVKGEIAESPFGQIP